MDPAEAAAAGAWLKGCGSCNLGTVAVPLHSHSLTARVAAAALVTVVKVLAVPVAVGVVVLVAVPVLGESVTAAENTNVSFEEGNEAEKPFVQGARKARWAWSK